MHDTDDMIEGAIESAANHAEHASGNAAAGKSDRSGSGADAPGDSGERALEKARERAMAGKVDVGAGEEPRPANGLQSSRPRGSSRSAGWSVTAKLLVAILFLNLFALGVWFGYSWRQTTGQNLQAIPVASQLPAPSALTLPNATAPSPASTAALGAAIGRETIADIAQRVAPSVVAIEAFASNLAAPQSTANKGQFFFGPGMRPDMPPDIIKREKKASGSGVIIREDGYILTNNHVVVPNRSYKVTLSDKRTFDAQLIGRDSFTDLALLKIKAAGLPVAKFGTVRGIRPGDWAIAIGNPFGFDHTVTLGIVSAMGRNLADMNHHIDLIQTDAAINPGNSGGPLINIAGDVIGINSAIRYDAQNIGFSIPADTAKEVAQSLLTHKPIMRPYLGVFMQDLNVNIGKSFRVPPGATGVLVARVVPGGPCDQSGVIAGDVIQKLDNVEVKTYKSLRDIMRKHKPGDVIQVVVSRGADLVPIKITIGDYPRDEDEQ